MELYTLLGAMAILGLVCLLVSWIRRDKGDHGLRQRRHCDGSIPGLQPRNESEGNLGNMAEAGSLHEFLTQLHKTYGPIASFWWGSKMVVSVHKPQNMKEYSTIFDRPAELFQLFEPLIGAKSIQFANGEDARRRHAAYSRCFNEAKVRGFYALWNEIAVDCLSKLADVQPGDHVIMREHCFDFTIKSILRAAFGGYFDDDVRVNDLKTSHDFTWQFVELTLHGEMCEPGSKGHREFVTHKKNMDDTIRNIVKWRADNPPSDENETLLVDVLIRIHGQDEDTLLADAFTMLVGGFHTTGQLLTWCLYYLAKHPGVQQRVLEEIDDVMGGDVQLTVKQFDGLKYTMQVLNESLRCAQLVGFAGRVADRDMQLTDGPVSYTVPAQTPVVIALGVAQKDGEYWPNPDEFDPERFDSEKYYDRPFGFEPFGLAGKRKCPGFRSSLHQAVIFLSHAIRRYKFSLVPGQSVKKAYGLVTSTEEEIWMTVEARSARSK